MKILLTSATSALGTLVAKELSKTHQLRLTDRISGELGGEYAVSALEHDISTNLLVRGMDAVVVVGEPLQGEATADYIDAMTRRLYNLLLAAHQEGVERVVYLSTLELLEAYGPEFTVTERWRPRPTPDPRQLGKHLGETICREFAREHKVKVVVLRLGKVVAKDTVAGEQVEPMWLEQKDLGAAIAGALTAELAYWTVLHVHSKRADTRFPIGDAERTIGFAPEGDFSVPSHLH